MMGTTTPETFALLAAVTLGAAIATVAAIDLEVFAMNQELLRTIATYGIATLVLLGAFLLIYQARGSDSQAWLAIGAVLGYVFRDAGGAAATGQAVRLQTASAAANGKAIAPTPADPG